MPTYDYQCPSCGHRFERMQPMSAKPKAKCQECGKSAQHQITGAAVIVKGGAPELSCGRNAPCPGAGPDSPCMRA